MNKILRIISAVAYSLIGYLLVWPISGVIPKKKNLILFLGGPRGDFVGNIKYMYLFVQAYCQKEEIECYFVTRNKEASRILKNKGLPVLNYPSIAAFKALGKANIAFVDNHRWLHEFKYFFLNRCRVIQLWHGPPIKKVGVAAYAQKVFKWRNFFPYIYFILRDRVAGHYTYSIVCCTSKFYIDNIFKKFMRARHYVNFGQPRNDDLPNDLKYLGCDGDALQQINNYKNRGYAIIYYLPTFREGRDAPLQNIPFKQLLSSAKKNQYLWVIKPHPNISPQGVANLKEIIGGGGYPCLIYHQFKDIHGCLGLADLLITDYSSVFMDYLFFDKPIIFYNYNHAEYVQNTRDLAFDYLKWTPGPKCQQASDLENTIVQILTDKKDFYKTERQKIFETVFDHRDAKASERIWQGIKMEYLTKNELKGQ